MIYPIVDLNAARLQCVHEGGVDLQRGKVIEEMRQDFTMLFAMPVLICTFSSITEQFPQRRLHVPHRLFLGLLHITLETTSKP